MERLDAIARRSRTRPGAHLRVSLPVMLLGLLLSFVSTGCSPSRTLAGAILRAPNTYPTWFAPPTRVSLGLPQVLLTNIPAEHVEVGPPPARLWVGRVAPGDYQSRVSSTNHLEGRRPVLRFSMSAVFPPRPRAGQAATVATPAGAPTALPVSSTPARGTVFFLHGYGVDSLSMLPWAVTVAEAGYLGVLVDLRGHGESTGRRIGFGTYEVKDLEQVLDYLTAQGKSDGAVAVMGESFGAALALRWAATDPRIAAAIALAPYAELEPAVLGVREDYASWMPRRWVRGAARRLPEMLGVPPATLDTSFVTAGLETPALLIAAGNDSIAPPPAVGRLARSYAGPVKYVVLPYAHHESLPYHFNELRELVLEWLATYCH